jgi:DNA-binding transcriptional LysR family regulator
MAIPYSDPKETGMTLWQLKAFTTVAREGGFTRAGKTLGISQPSVSALVIGLQKELGVRLFEKLGVRPHITEAGKRLLQLTESVLATVARIPEEMEEVQGLKKGRLVIGGSSIAASFSLPLVVQSFKEKHTGIEVILKIERSGILEKQMLDGELDLAVMSLFPRSRLLAAEAYHEEEVVIIARPGHPLTKKQSVPLALLAKEPWIVSEKGNPVRDMVESSFTRAGLPFKALLEVNLQLGSRDAIKSAVASGLGIGFSTKTYVLSDIKAGRLKVIKVPELKLKRSIYIVVHTKRKNSPFVKMFADFLRRHKKA